MVRQFEALADRTLAVLVPRATAAGACTIQSRVEYCYCHHQYHPLCTPRLFDGIKFYRNCERLNDCRWYCDPCHAGDATTSNCCD
jgi:hypothetical protein